MLLLHIVINFGTKKIKNMEKINSLLTYERDSKFGLTRLIASLLIFLICCVRIIDNSPHQIAKFGAFIFGVVILFLTGKFLYELITKYNQLNNLSPRENVFRLLLTFSFGAILVANFPPIYQIMVISVLIILLVSRFVFK